MRGGKGGAEDLLSGAECLLLGAEVLLLVAEGLLSETGGVGLLLGAGDLLSGGEGFFFGLGDLLCGGEGLLFGAGDLLLGGGGLLFGLGDLLLGGRVADFPTSLDLGRLPRGGSDDFEGPEFGRTGSLVCSSVFLGGLAGDGALAGG